MTHIVVEVKKGLRDLLAAEDDLDGVSIVYGRSGTYTGLARGPWIQIGQAVGRYSPASFRGDNSRALWAGEWSIIINLGSGQLQGSPEEADNTAYTLLDNTLKVITSNKHLNLASRGVVLVIPSEVETIVEWDDPDYKKEVVLMLTLDITTRIAR